MRIRKMSKALLIIDMQNFVIERIESGVNYFPLNSIDNMEKLLNRFRHHQYPILHVRHQTVEEGSALHPSSSSSFPMTAFTEQENEPVFIKNTSSAFASTFLKNHIDHAGISELIVIGAVAGYCVNSTVRMGSDLGIKMTVVSDAVISFDIANANLQAEDILKVTIGLLDTEFAEIINSTELTI